MTDSIPQLQELFESSIDHARSVGFTASSARLLLQLFALRFLSLTNAKLAESGLRAGDLGRIDPLRRRLEQLAFRTEQHFPELAGVFTDNMIPSLRSADALLAQWAHILDRSEPLLRDSAGMFGPWFDSIVDSVVGTGSGALQYSTPRPLADLMLRLSEAGPQHHIHDPCAGMGTLLAAAVTRYQDAPNMVVSGQEIDPGIAALARLRLFLLGARSASIKVGDVLRQPQFVQGAKDESRKLTDSSSPQLKKFDVVLCDPPYGQRLGSTEFAETDLYQRFQYGRPSRTSSDVAFLQHALASMAPGGCTLALIAHGPLFRSGGDAAVRRRLVAADVIDAVVGLPFGTLPGLSIEPALVICRESKRSSRRRKILFVDASHRRDALRNPAAWREFADKLYSIVSESRSEEAFAYTAETAEIAANQFSLQPRRYVVREKKRAPLDIRAALSRAEQFEAEAARHAAEMSRLSALLRPKEAITTDRSTPTPSIAPALAEPGTDNAQRPATYSIDDALKDLFVERHQFRVMLDLLRDKKNLILQGPPGVGKTLISKRLAHAFLGTQAPDRMQMVLFHQGYTYEDFIQGYRPAGRSGFRLKIGVFAEFCERAKQDPLNPYVFIIDEINRANLSSVFGEVMMLIEANKRGPEWAIPLASSETGQARFYVPENIYLIGLMNTADRSLALVDYGLRRRFVFVALEPQFHSKPFRAYLENRGATPSLVDTIIARMSALNSAIEKDLGVGADFRFGHSFLCDLPTGGAPDWAWYTQAVASGIAPLLHEYYFDRPQRATELLQALLKSP